VLRRTSAKQKSVVEEDDAVAVFDMVLLNKIDEKNVIRNLSNMYYEDMIYCYIGNVVISVNPFKDLPIYDEKSVARYRGRSAFDPKLPPHIFALADNVFSDMTWRGRDQVVIISGESGAGKTEAAKKVMQYIAAVSKEGPKVNEIKDKLLTTNPLLESFGNAKTTRNDNSSRFGKYMDIQFDFKDNPCGGVITTYLLEKARVTRTSDGERNFHIFYQLLSGGLAQKFGMKADPKAYNLLKRGEVKVRGHDDKKWYAECAHGFKAIGFSESEQKYLWESLGAVLMLGNLEFKSAGNGSKVSNAKEAESCAKLIGSTAAKVESAVTHNTVVAQGEAVSTDLNPDKAAHSRDTLCKAMYQRLFVWMCKRINESIQVDPKEIKAVIGVLDIYGFEIFKQNSFEQFCINYCNEKL
jgi:myosin-1